MKKIFILILLTIHLFGNTIEIAKDLFDKKEKYKEAIEIFQKFEDDAEAQYYLGKAYLYGMGVDKNEKKAFEYAKKSANKNNSSGLNLLGVIYDYAEGVNKDETKAFKYYEEAAKLGNTKAMVNLAKVINLEEAKKWLIKAHDLGDLNGTINLAFFLSSTEIKNYKEAIIYYDIYMKSGYKMTSYTYQRMAFAYEGIEEYRKAYEFYVKSIELGDKDSILDIIYSEGIKNIISDDEYLYWLKKGVELKVDSAYLSLYNYYLENEDYKNLKWFLEKAYYEDRNLEMGCYLSSYYLNLLLKQPEEINYEKAFIITTDIINNHTENKKLEMCYNNLSSFYISGRYVSKDIKKAIEINKQSLNVSQDFYKDDLIENIAQIYLEDLNDIDNAKIWYKKAYDLTKDEKYLTIVDRYIENLSKVDIEDKKNIQMVYPLLSHFSKKEQILQAFSSTDYYLFSVNDKSLKMFDKKNLKFIKEFRTFIDKGLSGVITYAVVDDKNQLLYLSTLDSGTDFTKNDMIKVFDIETGKIVKTIKNTNSLKNSYLEISEDGDYLVAINNESMLNIINIETNEIQYYNLNGQGKFTKAKIEKKDNDYLIYLYSTKNELFIFSLNEKKRIDKQKFNNQVTFREFRNDYNHSNFELSIKFFDNILSKDFEEIEVKNKKLYFKYQNDGRSFDLNSLVFKKEDNYIFKNEINTNSKYKILLENENTSLRIYDKNSKLISSIDLLKTTILNYKLIDDKYIIITTNDFSQMLILTIDGKPIVNLQGFISAQTNMLYENGFLYSYGEDNIVNIFDLTKLDDYSKNYQENNYNKDILKSFNQFFPGGNPLEMLTAELDFQQLKNFREQQNLSFIPTQEEFRNFSRILFFKKEEIKPLASLYIQNEKDWIIYTPEGLFTYGGNGKDLLKYHQNQGLYKEARIIENDRLFEKFYRPDLIKKILAGEKVEIPMDVKSVILNIMPPELKILVNKMLNIKDIELTYQVCDVGNGIADAKLIINGQAINPPQSRGFSIEQIDNQNDKCKIYKSVHTLYPGKSTIEFKAYDKDMNIANVSDKLEVTADYKIIEKSKNMSIDDIKKLETEKNNVVLEKSNLYFLSLAVGDYEDKNYNLKYPVNDVESVKEKFVKNSKNTFENIFTYKLQDNEVSRDNIDKIFNEISRKLKINDTFVLYIAGHGTTKDGKYQFIPYKIDEKISIDNIKQNLAKIANYTNKSLVMLDTCYSGAVIENISDNATTNRLSHDNNSINYIVASSSNQVALEGYNNHGVFTYSVLDAFDKNQTLKVNVLSDHVTELVPKITQEKFHFEQRPQVKLNQNFILKNIE